MEIMIAKEVFDIQAALDAEKALSVRLEQECRTYRKELTQAQGDRDAANRSCKNVTQNLDRLTKTCSQLQEELTRTKDELSTCSRELADAFQVQNTTKAALGNLKMQLDSTLIVGLYMIKYDTNPCVQHCI